MSIYQDCDLVQLQQDIYYTTVLRGIMEVVRLHFLIAVLIHAEIILAIKKMFIKEICQCTRHRT